MMDNDTQQYLCRRGQVCEGLFVVTRGIVTTSFALPPPPPSPPAPSSLPPPLSSSIASVDSKQPIEPSTSIANVMVDIGPPSSAVGSLTTSPSLESIKHVRRPYPPSRPWNQSLSSIMLPTTVTPPSLSSTPTIQRTHSNYNQTFPRITFQSPPSRRTIGVTTSSSSPPPLEDVTTTPLAASGSAAIPPTPMASSNVYDGSHIVEKSTTGMVIDVYSGMTNTRAYANVRSLTLVEGYYFRAQVLPVLFDDPIITTALWRSAASHVLKALFLSQLHPLLQTAGRQHANSLGNGTSTSTTTTSTPVHDNTSPRNANATGSSLPQQVATTDLASSNVSYGSTIATLPRVHFTDDTFGHASPVMTPVRPSIGRTNDNNNNNNRGGVHSLSSTTISSTCAWTYLIEYLVGIAHYHQVPRRGSRPSVNNTNNDDNDHTTSVEMKEMTNNGDDEDDAVSALPRVNLRNIFDDPSLMESYQIRGRTLVLPYHSRALLLHGDAFLNGSSSSNTLHAPALLGTPYHNLINNSSGNGNDEDKSRTYTLIGTCHLICWRYEDEVRVCDMPLPMRRQPHSGYHDHHHDDTHHNTHIDNTIPSSSSSSSLPTGESSPSLAHDIATSSNNNAKLLAAITALTNPSSSSSSSSSSSLATFAQPIVASAQSVQPIVGNEAETMDAPPTTGTVNASAATVGGGVPMAHVQVDNTHDINDARLLLARDITHVPLSPLHIAPSSSLAPPSP
jgi:hypothetical protein